LLGLLLLLLLRRLVGPLLIGVALLGLVPLMNTNSASRRSTSYPMATADHMPGDRASRSIFQAATFFRQSR
jgi:hypothetical protein